MDTLPDQHATLRIVPVRADVNAAGDIFGGWLLAQADIAGSIVALRHVKGRIVTVAVNDFHFIKPVLIGDIVSLYGQIKNIGHTSITVTLDIYIERKPSNDIIIQQVGRGQFTYVHLDELGQPLPITAD